MKRLLFGAAAALFLSAPVANAAGPAKINSCGAITVPGSYVVTQNLSILVPGAFWCIRIEADDVTLNLNGFQMYPGPGALSNGIVVREGYENAVIRNGTIRGYATAILFENESWGAVRGVRMVDNTIAGISSLGAETMMISGNIITRTEFPLAFPANSIVKDNIVTGNTRDWVGNCDSVVTGNVDSNNGGKPLTINPGPGVCIIEGNATD